MHWLFWIHGIVSVLVAVVIIILAIILPIILLLKMTCEESTTYIMEKNREDEEAEQMEMGQLGGNSGLRSPPPPLSVYSNACHISAN